MNTIVPVGNGFMLLADPEATPQMMEAAARKWRIHFPAIPFMVLNAALQVLNEKQLMFQFNDEINPDMIENFRAWWNERWPEHDRAIPPMPARMADPCDTC